MKNKIEKLFFPRVKSINLFKQKWMCVKQHCVIVHTYKVISFKQALQIHITHLNMGQLTKKCSGYDNTGITWLVILVLSPFKYINHQLLSVLTKGPVTPTWQLATTSAIVCDFINFQKACDMTRWIGEEMYKFLQQSPIPLVDNKSCRNWSSLIVPRWYHHGATSR